MKPQSQPQRQDPMAQLLMEVRRDALRFEHWLQTPEGQDWLDAAEEEDQIRNCPYCE